MNSKTLLRALRALLLLACTNAVFAQTTFVGIEPNQNKFEATLAPNMVAGDLIEVPTCGSFHSNVFRVGIAPAPPAIYRHTFSNSLAGIGYFSGAEVQGRDAILDLAFPQSVAILAKSEDALTTGSSQFVSWYGFGKSEELYVDFEGTSGCRGSSIAELNTSVVVPTVLTSLPDHGANSAEVSVWAYETSIDALLEIQVFDAEFNALYGHGTEGTLFTGGATGQTVRLHSGRYYIAVSDVEMATHLPPSSLSHFNNPLNAVMDFGGGIVNGSAAVSLDITLRIRDISNSTTETIQATKVDAFEVLWFQLDIGTTQETSTFCAGDGSVAPCPACSTESPLGSGAGCVNSTGWGGSLNFFRTPSFGAGTPRLHLDQLPTNALALVFLSLGTAPPTVSGGGLVCLGPGAIRLPIVTTRLDGMATLEIDTSSIPLAWLGQTAYAQAAYRDAAAAPCNVNITSGTSFPLW